jgi:RNA polymerase sigma factor (sigma-70 family)
MSDTITDIWQGVLEKDPESWDKLVHRLGPLVYSVVRGAGFSEPEADDLAQQTWVFLFQARHRIKDPDKLPAWLVRVATRTAIHAVRKKASEARAADEIAPPAELILPIDDVERSERAAIVHAAINALNERCRLLLQALFLSTEKKTYRDIARKLGIPPNSFGPTRARCLKKLRRILEELGFE